MKKFWMVWAEGNRSPAIKHRSELEARSEAERLARKHPGHIFHLLEATDSCRATDIVWENQIPQEQELWERWDDILKSRGRIE